ncbi:MAG TPA: hypothetical protein DDY32_10065 [Desulfobulbaceae bacterium]|nr:hypothetical protein [Desulfobulbaceae bacterium]
MVNAIAWLRLKIDARQKDRQHKQNLYETIEEIVEIADPKIRLARRYRTSLLSPVEKAVSHCRMMAGSIPGPVRLHQKTYYDNPLVKALFRTVDEMETLLRQGRKTAGPGAEKELFALLTMTKEETTIYGHKQQGEMILADVPMRAVTFIDHRIVAPSPDPQATMAGLVKRSLEILAGVALEEIGSLRANLAELRERRARLSSMRSILRGKRPTFEVFAQLQQENAGKLEELETLLGETEGEIETARKAIETPDDALGYLQRILESPAGTLSLRGQSLKLNWMNVLVEGEEPFHQIDLAELALNEELRRSALLVSFDR